MKLTTFILVMHLATKLFAQPRYVITDPPIIISDTLHLIYSGTYIFEIDSVLAIISSLGPANCESFEVYFDTNFTKLAFRSESFQDSCVSSEYWHNGQLKLRTVYYRDEDRYPVCGWDEAYCENGNRIYKGPEVCIKSKQLVVTYYCNGNKRQEFYMAEGSVDGKMTTWYENGYLESEKYFIGINEPAEHWKYYNQNGELLKDENYQNGKLVNTIHY